MSPETLLTMSDWRRRNLKALYIRPLEEKRRLAGIKSATEWRYSSLYGEMTRDGEIIRDGRKKSYSIYDPQGNQVERIEYDVSGNVIMRSTDRYDEQGRAIEGTYSGPENFRPEYWRNRYDARGSCVEVVTYTRGESTKTVRKFDNRGMEIEALTYDGTEHLEERVKSGYDDRGNKTEASSYDGKGKLYYRVITRYHYGQQGRKLEEATSYYNPNGTLSSSEVLSFDEYERLVRKVKTSDRDNWTESYHYDGNSNLTEVKGGSRSELGEWRHTYYKKFDEYGNLTEEVTSGGKITWRKPYYTTTIIRYEYYSDRNGE
jgi:YD repeat-containing protein